MIELLLFLILLVLVNVFMPGVIGAVISFLLFVFGIIFGIGVFSATFGATGWYIALGITFGIGIILAFLVPSDGRTAEELLEDIRQRQNGPEGNEMYNDEEVV